MEEITEDNPIIEEKEDEELIEDAETLDALAKTRVRMSDKDQNLDKIKKMAKVVKKQKAPKKQSDIPVGELEHRETMGGFMKSGTDKVKNKNIEIKAEGPVDIKALLNKLKKQKEDREENKQLDKDTIEASIQNLEIKFNRDLVDLEIKIDKRLASLEETMVQCISELAKQIQK